jgi:uncharacterized protein
VPPSSDGKSVPTQHLECIPTAALVGGTIRAKHVNMDDRFAAAAILFHTTVVLTATLLGIALVVTARRNARSWLAAFPLATLVLAGATLAAAVVLCRLLDLSVFALLRLLSQALFAEGLVIALLLPLTLWRTRRRSGAVAMGLLPSLLLVVYWDAYHIEPHALKTVPHALDATHSPRLGHLRIAHLSDIQTDDAGPYERRALRATMAAKPDLILLTGDYVHPRFSRTRDEVTADLRRMFVDERISAPLGVYAVRGNVDRDWPAVFQGTSITCLSDQTIRIPLTVGRALSLTGLDLRSSFGATPARTRALVAATPAADLRIVIGHVPDFAAVLAAGERVDLALAGHTHGGQIELPFFGPPVTFSILPRRFASGLNDYRGVPLHVTRGVGLERGYAPQVRFLCPPEICLLEVDY